MLHKSLNKSLVVCNEKKQGCKKLTEKAKGKINWDNSCLDLMKNDKDSEGRKIQSEKSGWIATIRKGEEFEVVER